MLVCLCWAMERLMKTVCILAIIISLYCVLSSTAFASTTYTAAYENGYAAGLRNDTITTACISYQGTAKWNDCDNGFNNGGAALQITTPEYQYGVQVAKNDSVIALYDASDACANYKQDYPKTSCKNGYGTVNSIVQKYRESAPFKTGFVNGAVNGNVTEACKNFRNRDMASCQNAYYYGKDPLGISPIHCSDIANSCLLNQLPGPPLPPPGITTGLPPVGLPPVSVICCQFGSHNLAAYVFLFLNMLPL